MDIFSIICHLHVTGTGGESLTESEEFRKSWILSFPQACFLHFWLSFHPWTTPNSFLSLDHADVSNALLQESPSSSASGPNSDVTSSENSSSPILAKHHSGSLHIWACFKLLIALTEEECVFIACVPLWERWEYCLLTVVSPAPKTALGSWWKLSKYWLTGCQWPHPPVNIIQSMSWNLTNQISTTSRRWARKKY